MVQQLIGCAGLFGGANISTDTIEWVLAGLKVWETEIEENPMKRNFNVVKEVRKNEDESSSDDDREYSSNQIRKYKF